MRAGAAGEDDAFHGRRVYNENAEVLSYLFPSLPPILPSAELDGVRVFNPEGKPIGHIDLPERCANLCFGGARGNRLFMAASHSLYALYVNTQGAVGGYNAVATSLKRRKVAI